MNKIKILLIFIVTFGFSGLIFYSMDFSVEKNNIISDKPVLEQENIKQEKNIEKEPEKEPIKETVLPEPKKTVENNIKKDEKEIKKIEEKKQEIHQEIEEQQSDKLFKRNIFARFHKKEEEKKPVEEVKEEEEEVKQDVIITDIINSINLNFVFVSDYDQVALINMKKYRVGDLLDGVSVEAEIISITSDSVILSLLGEEIEIKTGNVR